MDAPIYDSNCIACRYARPGDAGDHRDHLAELEAGPEMYEPNPYDGTYSEE